MNDRSPSMPISGDDLLELLQQDPNISVAILSHTGELLSMSPSSFGIMGVAPDQDLVGKTLHEIFVPQIADERLRWIQETLEQNRPLRVTHIYGGRRLISCLMPLACPPEAEEEMNHSDNANGDSMKGGGSDEDACGNECENEQRCVATLTRFATSGECAAGDLDFKTEFYDLGGLNGLTQRELEVLVLLGHGHSVPEAAKFLHRSPRTIEQHKSSIGRKLGLSTIAQIAKLVGEIGLTIDDTKLERLKAVRPEFAAR